jgi:type I restriction enzyme S subunit
VTIVRPKPGEFDLNFFGYALIVLEDQLAASGEGASGQTELARSVVAKFEISYPTDLAEQRRIVAVLDEAFAAIATATANAEKNLANARELFACTIEEILEGASGCQTMTLLAAADESCSLSYGIVQPGDEQAGGLPIVRPTDLQQKCIGLGPLKRIAPDFASGYQRTKLRGNELLLCVRGTTGTLSIAAPELAGGNVTRGIVPIRFNPAILSQKLGYYLLLSASVQKQIKAATYGTALMQINIRDLKQLELRVPKLASQDALADRLDTAQRHAEKLQANYSAKLDALTALKQSLLHRAFSGGLTSKAATIVALNDNFATPEFAAKIVAFAYERHVAKNRVRNFGTVKAEKILHMVEAIGGIDLGRQPLRDAAGPDDAKHRHATWDWARSQHFFRFNKRSGGGHDFERLLSYSRMIEDARTAIAGSAVEKAIELLVDMDRDFAELIATTYAAWNNLIIDQCAATDGDIVLAARDNWHRDKLRFDPSRFHDAIRFIRNNSIVPDGTAKRVGGQEALLF